jgi:acetylglutamate kinase
MTRVIKIGGNELSAPSFLPALAHQVAKLATAPEPLVIVHGGGQEIAEMQARLGIRPVMIDGLRVTDAESLRIAEMVLSGYTNKAIVRALVASGVDAVGLSGVDGGLLRCRKRTYPAADLGLVGEVDQVRAEILDQLLALGIVPVISPISIGHDGQAYNVNADQAAAAVAGAMKARRLDYVSNVPGVLLNGRVLPEITSGQAEELICNGDIRDGMIPKVRSALNVLDRGVLQVRVVDLDGLISGGGTVFRRPRQSESGEPSSLYTLELTSQAETA